MSISDRRHECMEPQKKKDLHVLENITTVANFFQCNTSAVIETTLLAILTLAQKTDSPEKQRHFMTVFI